MHRDEGHGNSVVTTIEPTNGGLWLHLPTDAWRQLLLDTGAVFDGGGFVQFLPGLHELDDATRIVIAAPADQPTVDVRWEVHSLSMGDRALLALACVLRRADGTESVQFTSLDLGVPQARRELDRFVAQEETALLRLCPHTGTLASQENVDAAAERHDVRRLLAATEDARPMTPGEYARAHTRLSARLAGAAPVWLQPLLSGSKVGRNAPCPCGSAAKFKRCCGNGSPSH